MAVSESRCLSPQLFEVEIPAVAEFENRPATCMSRPVRADSMADKVQPLPSVSTALALTPKRYTRSVKLMPTLRGVHSPDERLGIATVRKFWDLLTDVLVKIE